MEMQNPKKNNLIIANRALDKHDKLTSLFFFTNQQLNNFVYFLLLKGLWNLPTQKQPELYE